MLRTIPFNEKYHQGGNLCPVINQHTPPDHFQMVRHVTNQLLIKFFFLICAALLFFSCSRTEPSIEYGFLSLVYYQDNDAIKERFSFFIIPHDEDGINNLDELYLFHDFAQLNWKLTSADWITQEFNEKTWIGSWNLALDGDETLPRGRYRAVLVNKGGEKTQRYFSFDAPEENSLPFPTLEIGGGIYTVTSSYPDNRLLFYDVSGNFLSLIELTSLSGNISSLNFPASSRSAALWAEDSLHLTSAITEVASLR